MSASVTVSMAELSSGTLRLMRRVSRVLRPLRWAGPRGPGHQQQIIEGEGVFDGFLRHKESLSFEFRVQRFEFLVFSIQGWFSLLA